MSETTAEVSKTINAPPAEVWKALTTPKTIKKYFLGADVESDWQVGSPIRLRGEFKGKPYEDKGEILVAERDRRLSFSHWSAMSGVPDTRDNYHTVTFALVPRGQGTEVTLSQANLTGGVKPSDVSHRADYEKNWRTVLDGLAKVLTEPGLRA